MTSYVRDNDYIYAIMTLIYSFESFNTTYSLGRVAGTRPHKSSRHVDNRHRLYHASELVAYLLKLRCCQTMSSHVTWSISDCKFRPSTSLHDYLSSRSYRARNDTNPTRISEHGIQPRAHASAAKFQSEREQSWKCNVRNTDSQRNRHRQPKGAFQKGPNLDSRCSLEC